MDLSVFLENPFYVGIGIAALIVLLIVLLAALISFVSDEENTPWKRAGRRGEAKAEALISQVLKESDILLSNVVIETETEDVKVYDSTVLLDRDAVSDAAYALQQFCREHLPDSEQSVLVCLSCEEMLDYTAENADGHSSPNAVDVLKKVASLIEYNYVMSMNQTRIHLKRTTAALPAEEADQIKDTPDA